MRYALLFTLALTLAACAHVVQLTPAELQARKQRQIEEQARIAAEQEKAERDAFTRKLLVDASEDPGVMRASFDALHDKPTATEFRDGKLIYWYRDSDPPMYFEFKNDKLVGKYVDKETMRANDDRSMREREQREQAAQNERTRRLMILQGMQRARPAQTYQQQPYMMPTRQRTQCTSTRLGNTVQTNCD